MTSEEKGSIFKDSQKKIQKLHLLNAFFEQVELFSIFTKTKLIHSFFENNTEELDVSNLALFHLQFTESLLEVLNKLKKSNELNVRLILEEIRINEDEIQALKRNISSKNSFESEAKTQVNKIKSLLKEIYEILSFSLDKNPINSEIEIFSLKYNKEYFAEIEQSEFHEIIEYKKGLVYENPFFTIHKKLLGLLNRHQYEFNFIAGIKAGGIPLELYFIPKENEYFVFIPTLKYFLMLELNEYKSFSIETLNKTNISPKEKYIKELKSKIEMLEKSIPTVKTHIPDTVKDLLIEYHKKISDMNVLKQLNNLDSEANVLKTMLNTTIF